MLSVIKSDNAATSPLDRLNELKCDRQMHRDKLRDLADVTCRLDAALIEQRAAIEAQKAEQASLNAATIAWAAGGALCAAPSPDVSRQREIREAIVLAEAKIEAAQSAQAEIEKQRNEVAEKIAAIDSQIIEVALDITVAEIEELYAQVAHASVELERKLANYHGARLGVANHGRSLFDHGNQDKALPFMQIAERLSNRKMPETNPTVAAVDEQQLDWSRRFGALIL